MGCNCYAEAWPAESCNTAAATVAEAIAPITTNALLAARAEGMRAEREACAQLIENWHVLRDGDMTIAKLAAAIRAEIAACAIRDKAFREALDTIKIKCHASKK
jgi:hypothetical protein